MRVMGIDLMPNTDESVQGPVWLDAVLVYLLWAILIVISVAAFIPFRAALRELITLITGRSFADAFLYQAGNLIYGMSAFVFVMGAEPYLRSAADRRQTVRRFVRLVVPLAIFIIVTLAFLTLIPFVA